MSMSQLIAAQLASMFSRCCWENFQFRAFIGISHLDCRNGCFSRFWLLRLKNQFSLISKRAHASNLFMSQSLSLDLHSISVIIFRGFAFGFSSFLCFFNNISLAFNKLSCLIEFMLHPA